MIHIVFHRADLDGIGSCMVVLKHLLEEGKQAKDVQLHGWNYGEAMPEFSDGDYVFVVDCSFKSEEMQALYLAEHNGIMHVCWIDHHKTAYDDSVRHDYDKMGGVRVLGRPAAIQLCWNHFFGYSSTPKGIRLLSEYDTWCDEDKFYWNDVVMPFQFGMRHEPWLKDLMERRNNNEALCSLVDKFFNAMRDVSEIQEVGTILLAYQQTQNEITSKRAFSFRFHGVTFACINGFGNSQVFTGIEFMYEACMLFSYDGKKNLWRFSLYGVTDKGEESPFDLTDIAKIFGGGGHAKACGFEVAELSNVFGYREGPAMNLSVPPPGPRSNY